MRDNDRPLISVVTPSFNQAAFIERCICSVLEQGYENFEHIIQDNCSTDGTADVVGRYPHVTFIRERDAGQADALNRALRRARGEIIAWLNTDDTYEPGVFDLLARELHAESGVKLIAGGVHLTRPDGTVFQTAMPHFEGLDYLIEFWAHSYGLCQPGVFFRREVIDRIGLLDASLNFAIPYDLWLRAAEHFDITTTNRVLARYVVHDESKTGASRCGAGFVEEWERISRRYWGPRGSACGVDGRERATGTSPICCCIACSRHTRTVNLLTGAPSRACSRGVPRRFSTAGSWP